MKGKFLESYRTIFKVDSKSPDWAVHKTTDGREDKLIHCPIPFVGKDYYNQQNKILLYASAENLSRYHLTNNGYLDDDNFAIDRHRRFFDECEINDHRFYPDVHIQPITDGGLALVAFYIFCSLNGIQNISPKQFLEKIAFANYCKYTISGSESSSGKRNLDYSSNTAYLKFSRDYVKTDFSLLRPEYVIIPKSIYQAERDFIDSVKGDAKVIPIYQINARNINLRISKKYKALDENELPIVFKEWWMHLNDGALKGKTQQNFLSVFNYLDDIFSRIL